MHNRSRVRLEYSAEAVVHSARKGTLQGVVRDIGMESVYIYFEPIFDIDEDVELQITLRGKDSELCIKASGKVVRVDQDGTALRFLSPLEWWPVFSLFPFHQLDTGNGTGVN